MNLFANFTERHRLRLIFSGAGALASAVGLLVNLFWMEIFSPVIPDVVFDTRPAWLRLLMDGATYLPWLVLLGLSVLRAFGYGKLRPIAFGIGATMPWVALYAFIFFGPTVEEYAHRRNFDPTDWRENNQDEIMWPARLTMIDDLVRRRRLDGLTRDQVIALLGEPDRDGDRLNTDIVYLLGPARGFIRIESEWLVIEFEPSGKVVRYGIRRD